MQAAEQKALQADARSTDLASSLECQKMHTADVEAQAVHVLMRRDELMRAYTPLTTRMRAAEQDARNSRAQAREAEAERDAAIAANFAGLAQELAEKCSALELHIEELEQANRAHRDTDEAHQTVCFIHVLQQHKRAVPCATGHMLMMFAMCAVEAEDARESGPAGDEGCQGEDADRSTEKAAGYPSSGTQRASQISL